MHWDDALFGDSRPERSAPEASPPDVLPDWQVAQLRERLDVVGLVSMGHRQALVEELVGRPVQTLRHLTSAEARKIVEELARRGSPDVASGTAWDSREEDTWIDRL